jgi:hypothetical protein
MTNREGHFYEVMMRLVHDLCDRIDENEWSKACRAAILIADKCNERAKNGTTKED